VSTPTVKLLSSMASREWLVALAAQYARATGGSIANEFAGGVEVAKRVRAGAAIDLVVLARKPIDELTAEGLLQEGGRVDLVRSGIGIAVRAGAPRPAVGDEAGVRRAVLDAASIGYSTGPSGTYLEKLFERWGVLETVRPRITVAQPGVPVGSLVAEGRCALGFQQLSELIHLPGIEVLGPLPDPIQLLTVFAGAVTRGSTQADAARAVLAYLASPAAADTKRRCGCEPA